MEKAFYVFWKSYCRSMDLISFSKTNERITSCSSTCIKYDTVRSDYASMTKGREYVPCLCSIINDSSSKRWFHIRSINRSIYWWHLSRDWWTDSNDPINQDERENLRDIDRRHIIASILLPTRSLQRTQCLSEWLRIPSSSSSVARQSLVCMHWIHVPVHPIALKKISRGNTTPRRSLPMAWCPKSVTLPRRSTFVVLSKVNWQIPSSNLFNQVRVFVRCQIKTLLNDI